MKFDKIELEKKIREANNLSNEDKSNLLQLLREKKTYGLVWEDSTEDAWEKMKESIPVLKEVESKRIENGSSNPNHILIEGDNLNALTALSYTHEVKIDVIYIDPPYNTGNKDFAYYDDFCDEYRQIPYVDREDSYRHSKWLSFIEKRLRIAKQLLSGTGVVFISIDDNELANLKLLCDEIFEEKNFVANLIWKSKSGGAHDATAFGVDHEYILCYAKDYSSISLYNDKEAAVTTSYNKIDSNGKRYALDRLDKQSLGYVASLDFPIIGPDGKEYIVEHKNPKLKKARWRWSKDTVKERYDELVFIYPYVYTKNYEKEGGQKPRSILFDERFGRTRTGSTDLSAIIGKQNIFSYPKPVSLLKYILSISSNSSAIILDFFAGSGTTMHATMKLNAEDGGHRQCILVTNNENNICEEVTYERNKRVIEGYTTPKGEFVEGLKNNNLRYYKVDFKDREQTHQSNRKLCHDLKDLLCIKEDINQEQHQFGSLPLVGKERMIRYFAEDGKDMLMVYDTRVIPFIVKEIEKMGKKELPLKIYIFADGAYPYADDFASVINKVSLVPMPYAYYRGIKDSLPEESIAKLDDVELTNEEREQMMAEAIEAENSEKKEG